ncbi:hypothetical protein [Collimonas humicola]|uniref:hypothetical protein n=1 Tax=Collimonas humicola TaxID=2825886 RepID=UPI001B8BCBF0|nr:hypothetical protein [Collimonas humicola]
MSFPLCLIDFDIDIAANGACLFCMTTENQKRDSLFQGVGENGDLLSHRQTLQFFQPWYVQGRGGLGWFLMVEAVGIEPTAAD